MQPWEYLNLAIDQIWRLAFPIFDNAYITVTPTPQVGEAKELVRDAIAAGIFNDLVSTVLPYNLETCHSMYTLSWMLRKWLKTISLT